MTSTAQHRAWTSERGRRAASGALALAIVLVSAVLATRPAQAQTFSVLYAFTGGADGGNPATGLIRDVKGNFYGTTVGGGASGVGVVFMLDTSGKETVIHGFTGTGGDGAEPLAGLVRDAAGNLYGTTRFGGVGFGTVFSLDKTGKETVLYSFSGGADGGYPVYGYLVRDAAGNLYGTTSYSGTSGYGTVFMLDKTVKETVLYNFTGSGGDGAEPWGGLVRDANGNLYGTTVLGGGSGGYNGYGTVFKLDKTGKETVLHRFSGAPGDGANPVAGLVRDASGNLYGTTSEGGTEGRGTVFKVDKTGNETVLYNFTGTGGDGGTPYAGLLRDAAGNLYGTTVNGGIGYGTAFKLDQTGKETVYRLNYPEGGIPYAGLVLDAKGNLYGTALEFGSFHYGTVFKLTP